MVGSLGDAEEGIIGGERYLRGGKCAVGGLNVGWQNIRGSITKKVKDIKLHMEEEDIAIFGIGETNLKTEKGPKIEGYEWIGRGTSEAKGGVGIYIKENMIRRRSILVGKEGWRGVRVFTSSDLWIDVIFMYLWQNNKKMLDVPTENKLILE